MYLLVPIPITRPGKGTATIPAFERPFIVVISKMISKNRWPAEGFGALVTAQRNVLLCWTHSGWVADT